MRGLTVIALWRTVRGWHSMLAYFAVAMPALTVVSAVGYLTDPRILGGGANLG